MSDINIDDNSSVGGKDDRMFIQFLIVDDSYGNNDRFVQAFIIAA